MTTFVKGLDLCESFFREIAQPILNANFPSLRYAAGVIGYGSDTLGYDDEMSTDHMWGPRFYLFLPEADFAERKSQIAAALAAGLPPTYKGYSTHFSAPDATDNGVRRQESIDQGPVNPLIETHTLRSFFEEYLGYTPFDDISIAQWLTFTEHRLLGTVSGRVFHDDLGLREVRNKLHYFPRDVWLWMMAAQWTMIAEEEAFVGRCGMAGDDLGSRFVAARQVQRIMRLCYLQEQRYAPYSKWFGTGFRQLAIAPALLPILELAVQASGWQAREAALAHACSLVAGQHNALGLTAPLSTQARDYFGRPFQVLFAARFGDALLDEIESPELKQLVPAIGSVSQFTESQTVSNDVRLYSKLRTLYLFNKYRSL